MSMHAYPREKLTAMALLVFLAAGSGAGCNRKEEPGKPSGVPPLDPGAAPSAAAPKTPAPVPSAPAAPATAPAMPGAAPAPSAEAPAPDSPAASITGSIVLAPAVAKAKPKGGTLYLVARRISDNPTARGTLIAVK